MSRAISLVQQVKIASPCTAKWDDMAGHDRLRFCSHCTLNVYNLSAMTEAEGEALIIEKEGRLCTRIYQRADGTILTRDCPVGLRAVRNRLGRIMTQAAAAVVFIVTAGASAVLGSRPQSTSAADQAIALQAAFIARLNGAETDSAHGRIMSHLSRWLTSSPQPAITITMGMPAPLPPPTVTSDSLNLKPNSPFHTPPVPRPLEPGSSLGENQH